MEIKDFYFVMRVYGELSDFTSITALDVAKKRPKKMALLNLAHNQGPQNP